MVALIAGSLFTSSPFGALGAARAGLAIGLRNHAALVEAAFKGLVGVAVAGELSLCGLRRSRLRLFRGCRHGGKMCIRDRQESLRYNAHIREEIGFLPLRILAQQDSDHVQILKRQLLERMAPASARRILGDCRAMINRGIKKGRWSGINPFGKERLEMPRLQNKGERFLSRDEAKSLLAALARRSPQLHDMACLLYTSPEFPGRDGAI